MKDNSFIRFPPFCNVSVTAVQKYRGLAFSQFARERGLVGAKSKNDKITFSALLIHILVHIIIWVIHTQLSSQL